MTDYRGLKCIIRSNRAGVFFGEVADYAGSTVELKNARRIWRWEGACSCSDLAMIGTTSPNNCQFTAPVNNICIFDVIEIIPASIAATTIIEGVREWTMKK